MAQPAGENGSGSLSAQAALTRNDDAGGGDVPLSIWTPGGAEPQAIVLIGHGGSQHRRAEMVEAAVRAVNAQIPAYVVAIDGPVQGDRLSGEASATTQAFVQTWTSEDGGVPLMLADWRKAIAIARGLDGAAGLPVGYYGVSMGTAYGLPLLADQPAIDAAAIGMWDAAAPKAERHRTAAPHIHCPVQFCYRRDDSLFTLASARELFESIGSADKEFVLLEGPHGETDDQIAMAAKFLARHLRAKAGA